ncbi:MAG: ExbD/TolR family protein [Akkermansiaceae bacterium]
MNRHNLLSTQGEIFDTKGGLQIAPLIDVVFLLLIYFMVTSSLKKSEGDLGITLPGIVKQAQPVDLPDEQVIEVLENGHVVLNGQVFGEDGIKQLPKLQIRLTRFKSACDAAKIKAMITVQAEADAQHERVMDVMNVCAGAKIKYVTFGIND